MTIKHLTILPLFILLSNCNDRKEIHPLGASLKDTADKAVHNSKNNNLVILSGDKYIFEIRIDSSMPSEKYLAWTAGIYTSHADTLYITMPADSSDEFRRIKNNYFYADTSRRPYGLYLNMSAEKLADSLLHQKCPDCGEIVSHYVNAKAIIRKDKIIFLPSKPEK
ncbi:MAG: hypothetical protein ACXVP0_03425 [Bacteroidia bacterium]